MFAQRIFVAISRRPFSFTAHAKDIYRDTVDADYWRRLLEHAAFAVTVTEANLRHRRALADPLADRKLRLIHNRVDLERLRPRSPAATRDGAGAATAPGLINGSPLRYLSVLEEGPRLAREALEKHGIAVVVERHLPQTYLDGAAFLRDDGVPVIGLTLRHDKLDNFWFTLLHELVHAGRHLVAERTAIFDDIGESATDEIEREADAIAAEALIPEAEWRDAKLNERATPAAAHALARRLNRHPAIVVGRLQRELEDYRLLAKSPGVGRACEATFRPDRAVIVGGVQRLEIEFPLDVDIDAMLERLLALGLDRYGNDLNIRRYSNDAKIVVRYRLSDFESRLGDVRRRCRDALVRDQCSKQSPLR